MFKNWSNTNKTIAVVVVLALVALVLYEMKVFGNETTLLNLRGANGGNGRGALGGVKTGATAIRGRRLNIKPTPKAQALLRKAGLPTTDFYVCDPSGIMDFGFSCEECVPGDWCNLVGK